MGDELVGLARIVGDGLTIAYLQDILVRPSHHRRGIGRVLFSRAFEPYDEVRQKVLMTDCDQATRSFYEAMGFTETRDQAISANRCAFSCTSADPADGFYAFSVAVVFGSAYRILGPSGSWQEV